MAKNWSDTPHEDAARTEYEKSMNQSYNDAQSFRALAAQLALALAHAKQFVDLCSGDLVYLNGAAFTQAQTDAALDAARKAGIL